MVSLAERIHLFIMRLIAAEILSFYDQVNDPRFITCFDILRLPKYYKLVKQLELDWDGNELLIDRIWAY